MDEEELKPFVVKVLWGNNMGCGLTTIGYDTKGEVDAFIKGIDEACKESGYNYHKLTVNDEEIPCD